MKSSDGKVVAIVAVQLIVIVATLVAIVFVR